MTNTKYTLKWLLILEGICGSTSETKNQRRKFISLMKKFGLINPQRRTWWVSPEANHQKLKEEIHALKFDGLIQVIEITDKQFGMIDNVWGVPKKIRHTSTANQTRGIV